MWVVTDGSRAGAGAGVAVVEKGDLMEGLVRAFGSFVSELLGKLTVAAGDGDAGAGAGDWQCIAIHVADINVGDEVGRYE